MPAFLNSVDKNAYHVLVALTTAYMNWLDELKERKRSLG